MANTTNYNWETPDDTDLVKDGAAAIRTLGSSIDTTTKNLNPETTTGDIAYRSATANTNTRLAIGTTGQVLTVAAGVPSWATPTDQTPLTTKGDVFTFSTVDARLGVGANGTVLTADSAEATGLKWATPAGGGKVLQVVSAKITTSATNSTNVYATTNITASITPSSASSKVLVLITGAAQKSAADAASRVNFQLKRSATTIFDLNNIGYNNTAVEAYQMFAINYVDSPATTSSTTYTLNFANGANSASVSVQLGGNESSIVLLEIGA